MARETFVKIAACMNRPAAFGHLDPDDIVSVVFFVAEVGFDSIVTGEFFGSNDIECSYAPHVAGELADFSQPSTGLTPSTSSSSRPNQASVMAIFPVFGSLQTQT